MNLNPESLKLNRRDTINVNGDEVIISKERKSRIVMKDGKKILRDAEKIRVQKKNARIIIRTDAPVCSKTRSWLAEHNISFINMNS